MTAAVPEPSSAGSDRLATALRLALSFRAAQRTDHAAFLTEHEALRELLAPMLVGDRDAAGDGDASRAPAAVRGHGSPWAIGTLAAGYRIESVIGRGGMGTVMLATETGLGRLVAVKALHAGASTERALWRFQREARLLAQLDHPGIVKVLAAGVHAEVPFYAMEFVDGASLRHVLENLRRSGLPTDGRPLQAAIDGAAARFDESPGLIASQPSPRQPAKNYPAAIAQVGAEVADALACAHAAGIVHRDVKPANVLLRRDGRALLADFGIARREAGPDLTLTGDIAGTPFYMSPEQARGDPVDHRSDLFALGTVLYEALTLQRPFDGETTLAVLDRLQKHEPEAPQRLNPALPRDLAAIVLQAMNKLPSERYQHANAMAADLRAFLAGEPVTAHPPNAWRRLRRWARREPWQAIAATTAMATLLVIGVGSWLFTRRLVAEGQRTAAALDDVRRLAIGVWMERAERKAEAFRVAKFELVPAMTDWLVKDAEPLAAEIPKLEALLAMVRQRANPYDEATVERSRQLHPAAAELAVVRSEAADWATRPAVDDAATTAARAARIELVRERERRLTAEVDQRAVWEFGSVDDQFLHDQIVTLLARLRTFAETDSGPRRRVAAQREWAEISERRCRREAAASWSEAAEAIVADPRFAGLTLKPQRDLVPLGKDPASGLWEFVLLRSGQPMQELPQRDARGRLVVTAATGIVFVLLPGGKFRMGAQNEDEAAPNYTPFQALYCGPVHEVELGPFFLAKHEITRAQWARLACGDQPSAWTTTKDLPVDDACPVESVSWQRAHAVLSDHGLELPTEAQWEYACRAGTNGSFYWGDRLATASHANTADAAAKRAGAPWNVDEDIDDGALILTGVGKFEPNAFGLHDMLGNVAEITRDQALGYGRLTAPGDGRRLSVFDDSPNVMFRGGSFMDNAADATCHSRTLNEKPTYASGSLGVRAARAIER
jgi:serine/threonine protein kinase/formylglycine-generating enzyme required for sulfatase activity